ncbi:hypothetical protein PSACC_02481 [Paramicrosporidium saccamoebae]|uniref:glycerol kinase n=1 Tax=Paramicrosporidium saccamoebae TaxID=1246581 RepID=A0A2H9TJ18_9FUNG|nr:hypothetical protein PSACC_02481 [Paramicrosporidium saccamoebae]
MEFSRNNWIGAVDQGTTSTRFFVFDEQGQVVASAQQAITLKSPSPGWIEHDPEELVESVKSCIETACRDIWNKHNVNAKDRIKAIGITNQRETTIAWSQRTGRALHPALVWMDTRNRADIKSLTAHSTVKELSGLPYSTYFSAGKMKWLIENVSDVKQAFQSDELRFGTVDSWLLRVWNPHVSDVTNAHRTSLLNLQSLQWDQELLDCYKLPPSVSSCLPSVKPSVADFGVLGDTCLQGVPVSAALGDQHAALLGRGCTEVGQVKNTYGTGCFLLCNVGTKPILTDDGLVSTVAYHLGASPVYALEAPIASAGSSIEWLKSKLGMLVDSKEIVVFVPALAGLLSPEWDPDVSGALLGMRLSTGKGEIIKSVLEAISFSNKQVLDLMGGHVGTTIKELIVDGGLTNSRAMMQTQADALGIPVVRPYFKEATVFGAAKAAAIGIGMDQWPSKPPDTKADIFTPNPSSPAFLDKANTHTDTSAGPSTTNVVLWNQKDHEVLRKAAEAGKEGKKLPEFDEKGQLVNPYIPMYISKAPCMSLCLALSFRVTDSDAHHLRGLVSTEPAQKFRKNACENCGAITHKSKDCLERPRKRGARWTGKDMKPDEYIQEASLGFEGKRDRWAGYDADEYVEVLQDWEQAEAERKAAVQQASENGKLSSEDEELYAETVDMPGQKVDLKTRMTVRNLRLREDTAKYLTDLSSDAALYDPKTRSMRLPEATGFVPEDQQEEGRFAWERPSGKTTDATEPTANVKRKRVDPRLEEKYGSVAEPLARVEVSDRYVEYDGKGNVTRSVKR